VEWKVRLTPDVVEDVRLSKDKGVSPVVQGAIIVGVVLLIGLGFYLTRGGGGVPGGISDEAQQSARSEYTPLGDHVNVDDFGPR
jgi:hypothetical protein